MAVTVIWAVVSNLQSTVYYNDAMFTIVNKMLRHEALLLEQQLQQHQQKQHTTGTTTTTKNVFTAMTTTTTAETESIESLVKGAAYWNLSCPAEMSAFSSAYIAGGDGDGNSSK